MCSGLCARGRSASPILCVYNIQVHDFTSVAARARGQSSSQSYYPPYTYLPTCLPTYLPIDRLPTYIIYYTCNAYALYIRTGTRVQVWGNQPVPSNQGARADAADVMRVRVTPAPSRSVQHSTDRCFFATAPLRCNIRRQRRWNRRVFSSVPPPPHRHHRRRRRVSTLGASTRRHKYTYHVYIMLCRITRM